ncbi:PREDICTED: uncharacterized protein LOC106808481 [Priapulus caudatus]|uniref:Uncharacterized protein LOC106808481 n=1 Tax=Priapulus caudatus TaxID=37621 RepID=A0ABM1E3D1_PRICU|nr:PREDICTED: uncharacterized protein LOC106808481 [Priapulus caudatus]
MQFIEQELKDVKQRCTEKVEGSEVEACVSAMVRVRIRRTKFKDVTVCLQFPKDYPNRPLVVELKSKTLPDKLLDGLSRLCEKECAEKHLGREQVLLTLKFVRTFIDENPLCVCSDEISRTKRMLSDGDDCKLKQKSGLVLLRACQGLYFIDVKLSLPDTYPEEQVGVELRGSNFPKLFNRIFMGNAIEIARRCVEPPIKKRPKDPPFVPQKSLLPVTKYLINDCVKYCATQVCALCKKACFPDDPKNVEKGELEYNYAEKVYCGHLFHYGCMDAYMKIPPFQGGKQCPNADCKKRIYHNKWRATPEVAEARWAHAQAKDRELAEVVDFLVD